MWLGKPINDVLHPVSEIFPQNVDLIFIFYLLSCCQDDMMMMMMMVMVMMMMMMVMVMVVMVMMVMMMMMMMTMVMPI